MDNVVQVQEQTNDHAGRRVDERQLEEQELCYEYTYGVLAESINNLKYLTTFRLNILTITKEIQPLVDALQNRPSLQKAAIEYIVPPTIHDDDNVSKMVFNLNPQQTKAIEPFPRIHRTMKQHDIPNKLLKASILLYEQPKGLVGSAAASSPPKDIVSQPGFMQNYIHGLASLNDRFDCFHILFSCLAPTLCAEALIRRRRRPAEMPTSQPIEHATTTTTTTTNPLGPIPYVPTILWDPSFVQKLKDTLSSSTKNKKVGLPSRQGHGENGGGHGTATTTASVFPIPQETQLLTDKEKRDSLWDQLVASTTTSGTNDDDEEAEVFPSPLMIVKDDKKWIQGLTILSCLTLPEVATVDCSSLVPDEVNLLLSTRFPSLQESLQYTFVNPFKMSFTINSLQAFLFKQAEVAAQSSSDAVAWHHCDERWNHLRPEDRIRLQEGEEDDGNAAGARSVVVSVEELKAATTGKKRSSPSPSRCPPLQEQPAEIPFGDSAGRTKRLRPSVN